MRGKLMTSAALAILAVAGWSRAAPAAAPVAGMVGSGVSRVAGCPYIEWRLARHPDGQITGIVYYSDLSGTSQASGTIAQNGKIDLTLTSQMGNGPVGTVTGQRRSDGAANVTLTGPGCANMHMVVKPVQDMANYHTSAG